jgi:UDP-glucose 4-epimerase
LSASWNNEKGGNMNIFVTGGTGFIGSYVVHNLVQKGHNVTILARKPDKIAGFLNNPLIELIKGSVTDYNVIERGLIGKDACIHIALGWGETATTMLENDTLPSIKIFELAIKSGVKQILYTSSTAAIGDLRPLMNESTTTRPVDYYGATKAATENYTFGNPVIPGAPMQPDRRMIDIVVQAKKGEPINLVKNDGTQFIWAGDLALLYEHILLSQYNRSITFGLASEFITWEDIAIYAIEYISSKSEIVLEDRGWEKGSCWFDDSKIKSYLDREIKSMERMKEHIRFIADWKD